MKKRLEPFTGYLLVAETGAIVEYSFSYRTTGNRKYNAIMSNTGFENVSITESIYTSNLELPFAINSRIRLADNRVLQVENAQKDIDEKVATFDGIGHIGWFLDFNGGGE